QVLEYYYKPKDHDTDWSHQLNNIDVVKYLFDRGYGRDITSINLVRIDINLLEYYLENHWLDASILIFIEYKAELEISNKMSRIDLKDKIELIVKYIESIDPEDLSQLFENMIERPIPSLIKPLYHLLEKLDALHMANNVLQAESSMTLEQARNSVQEEEDRLVAFANSMSSNNDNNNNNISVQKYKCLTMIQEKLAARKSLWPTWINNQGQEFIKSWQQSSRIKVTTQNIYYSFLKDGKDHQTLSRHHKDIASIICMTCGMNVNVQAFRFMYQQGFTSPNINYLSYQELVRLTSDQDRDAIVELSNSPFVLNPDHDQNIQDPETRNILSKDEILSSCCEGGHDKNLDYYLGKFKAYLVDQEDINELFMDARQHRDAIKVLYSHGFTYTGMYDGEGLYNHCWFDKFSKDRVTTALRGLGPDLYQSIKGYLLDQLIEYIVIKNDYVSFKYLLDNNSDIKLNTTQDPPDEDLIGHLASSTNINIIDYINKNKSTCLSSDVDINSFFGSVFIKANTKFVFNAPFTEYLVTNNLITTDLYPFHPATLDSFGSKVFNLFHFIYFAHHYKYIDHQTNSSMTLVEFISRNQYKCHGELHFLSIYGEEGLDKHGFSNLLVDLTNTYDIGETKKYKRW
ncbi:hypothetical protein CYY_008019, partial [Polysphondylium violaceum]